MKQAQKLRPVAGVAGLVVLGSLVACSTGDAGQGSPRAVAISIGQSAASTGRPALHQTIQADTLAAAVTSAASPAAAASGTAAKPKVCPPPKSSIFRADVSKLPVDQAASGWELHGTSSFHPDFGSGKIDGKPFGIPVTTITAQTAAKRVRFDYADESDGGGYHIPANVKIEGGPDGDGDRHALLLNRSTCRLEELYSLKQSGSAWLAGSGARWNLRSNAMRKAGWTSADAAGLPIEPLLVSYADVARGDVGHAIRFTMPATSKKYVWPASHQAGRAGVAGPPMGAWFRLRPGVPSSGFGKQSTVIVKAMKKYGIVLADNGSAWYLSGTQDARWDNDDLNSLKTLKGSDFVAVDVSALKVSSKSYARRQASS